VTERERERERERGRNKVGGGLAEFKGDYRLGEGKRGQ